MIPVDADRLTPFATGNVNPVPVWTENADGSRSRSDAQATNESGVPLWNVEILRQTVQFGEGRMSAVSVQVPAPQMPNPEPMTPAKFRGLEADFYVSRNQLRERWTAEGIEPAAAQRPAPKEDK